jgi:hypothetical protein
MYLVLADSGSLVPDVRLMALDPGRLGDLQVHRDADTCTHWVAYILGFPRHCHHCSFMLILAKVALGAYSILPPLLLAPFE